MSLAKAKVAAKKAYKGAPKTRAAKARKGDRARKGAFRASVLLRMVPLPKDDRDRVDRVLAQVE